MNLTPTEQVSEHIRKLEPDLASTVEAIRQIILGVDPEISERIKWNNPSFYYTGEMQDFDPKEYKRDLIVLNLFKGRLMLVFPSGGRVHDPSELLEGNYKDGRKVCVFKDQNDVAAKKDALVAIIKDWLATVEK